MMDNKVYHARGIKRILVAGGAGFLGAHLCEKLLDSGHFVIALDNFHTGSLNNLSSLKVFSRFEILEADVTSPLSIDVDAIYNLASPASPLQYQKNPVNTIKTNVLGAIHLLELAKKTGAKILQASTSEVYGDPSVHPQNEAYWGYVNPIGIRSCYDEGKRCAETLFFDYHRQYGVSIKVARIFNTYGPKMDAEDGRVVSNFIVQALKGEPLAIFGNGSQTRAFCYVDDLIEGLIRLMETEEGVTGPVNLGNPQEFTIKELAALIIELTGSSSEIIFQPLPQDDPKQRRPDISLAKKLLYWEPQVALREGLIKTIAYFGNG